MIVHSNTEEMKSGSTTQGVLFVALGASSYGMLSTIVKLAYQHGFTTAEVVIAQFVWGLLFLTVFDYLFNKKGKAPTSQDTLQLLIAGIPLGLTSLLYYTSVKYINASIAVVLLMQSVWIGVVVESIHSRRWPSMAKALGVVLVLFGTVLATNALNASSGSLDIRGVIFGFLSALSFSWTLFSNSAVASHLPVIKRSQLMVSGGMMVALVFSFLTQIAPYYLNFELLNQDMIQSQAFNFSIFSGYGLLVALFGTVMPPLLLNKGFPIIGVGLGSIVASAELPCAVLIAFALLHETVNASQWLGVVIILAAIVVLNYRIVGTAKETLGEPHQNH
ncbi:EamA family transporter [Pseudobdellovibrio exovorus]|uniref:EamA domain-containing protein n=1 Tax=Pseudobdellovibrio exovorus JSS TaxID=1184267 RepID=M4VNG9_9BACT|nr:EamA family transporter [Pseudobdellovibrio exovorus]AGH94644.1 hypothetical protein A11Q_424 [Pseudobdellovibrio exovorus JSS]